MAEQGNPIVKIKNGKLRGTTDTFEGRTIYMFKGIPYAAPPIGNLRFKAPIPCKSWEGVRDATIHGPVCPQYDMTTLQLNEGNEDCLYLNVYSKSLSAKQPVMVFIHGGAFMSGSGDDYQYGPQFLLQHDLVLVTINYRLEVLGFLALDTSEVPGNAGLKDQVLALKWVQQNISKFGGDPSNVTIFGESAGAASVTYHLLSTMSTGLFHKAIAQSGTCLNNWAIANEPKARAFRIAKALGKNVTDSKELLDFLQSVPAKDLVKMTFKTATDDEKKRGLAMHFVPNIEKKFSNVQSFITEDPIDLLLSNRVNKVPLIIGYTSAEGLLMTEAMMRKIEHLNRDPSYLVPRDIAQKISISKSEEFGQRILKYYTKGKGFDETKASDVTNICTDIQFAYPIYRFTYFYNNLKMPIYFYTFEYETELNVIKNLLGMADSPGACHADDLFYLFCGVMNKDIYMDNRDKLAPIVYGLTKLWTDFAKNGNPTPDKSSSVSWPAFTTSKQEFLSLNLQLTSGQLADRHRMEFWNNLYRDAGLACVTNSRL